jgi:DNA polymerase (family 10)
MASMKNSEVAEVLYDIADLLEVKGIEFKPRAYRRAAQTVETMSEDVTEVMKRSELEQLPGIGTAIAEKITEFVETGELEYYEKLKQEVPIGLTAIMDVEGIGPKSAKKLYEELGVASLDDLERAARQQKIRDIPGFGEKTESQILENLEFARRKGERHPLGFSLPVAQEISERLEQLDVVERVGLAGSLRRRRATIGDVDVLVVSSRPEEVTEFFTSMSDVADVLVSGPSKTSIRLEEGLQVDLRIVEKGSFGAAMQYFTGSKQHNIRLRNIAIDKGLKLNEYGLFRKEDDSVVAGEEEEEIYRALGLEWMPPELREDRGEVEAALKGELPDLIPYGSIKGDLQVHTEWSDGNNTIQEMAEAAKAQGYEYLAITDHTGSLAIAGGLDEERMREQGEEIEEVNEEVEDLVVLRGAEVNIRGDGTPDIDNAILAELDIVVGSIHSGFRMNEENMTRRMVTAMENEHIDIIAHPTGRLLEERKGYEVDIGRLIQASLDTGTLLEINAFPTRLDLDDVHIRRAVDEGAKLVISTDSHDVDQLRYMELGVSTARRGWATAEDIVNTRRLEDLRSILKG